MELGLATLTLPPEHALHHHPESEPDESAKADETTEPQLRCLKCYSADVTCRELDKPLNTESWLSEPLPSSRKFRRATRVATSGTTGTTHNCCGQAITQPILKTAPECGCLCYGDVTPTTRQAA